VQQQEKPFTPVKSKSSSKKSKKSKQYSLTVVAQEPEGVFKRLSTRSGADYDMKNTLLAARSKQRSFASVTDNTTTEVTTAAAHEAHMAPHKPLRKQRAVDGVTGELFDSAATDHMRSSLRALTNVKPFTESNGTVLMGGNELRSLYELVVSSRTCSWFKASNVT
jgi:hypothetical protein